MKTNTLLGKLYLIPTVLHDDDIALKSLSTSIPEAVKECQIFFVENERTARRFLKKIWKEMVIDDYIWHTIHKAEDNLINEFKKYLTLGKTIGILSEAGCPCIADPGQKLVAAAHSINAKVIPLTGPSSILLALMASGMNGQGFKFYGYLPIDSIERKKVIKDLETDSAKNNCTQIFIETPYRNNQLFNDILLVCNENTFLCIALNITSSSEKIITKNINAWKNDDPQLHKHTVVFLLYSSNK